MKNKLTAVVSVAMSILLAASVFTACSFNKNSSEESTTLSPDESWHPGANETYQAVEIEDVELAAIVSKALGEEAEGFNGDLKSLSADQLKKVKDEAQKEGYLVDTNANGDTVIKKTSNIEVEEVPADKAQEILDEAGVKSSTRVNRKDYERVSRKAEEKGATAVTDKNNNITIISTTVKEASQNGGAPAGNDNTRPTRAGTPGASTTSGGSPVTFSTASPDNNNPTAGTTAKTTTAKTTTTRKHNNNGGTISHSYSEVPVTTTYRVSGMEVSAANTFGSKGNCILQSCDTADGGAVFVGNTIQTGSEKPYALIAKYNEKGKKKWSDIVKAEDTTRFADVAVLNDGSIIAVGVTHADDLVKDSVYRCKGTVEGIIARYTSGGNRQKINIFGGSGTDIIYAVAAAPDGGYYIGGKSDSPDFDLRTVDGEKIRAFIAKFDSADNLQWVQALTSTHSALVADIAVSGDSVFAVIQTNAEDGSYAGLPAATNGRNYSVVEKVTSSGELVWMRDFYETGQVILNSIAAGNDGGCVVAGRYSVDKRGNKGSFATLHNGGSAGTPDGIIVHISNGNNIKWMLPLVGFHDDEILGITTIPEGYVFTGKTTSTNRDFPFPNKGDFDAFVGTVANTGDIMTMRSYGGNGADVPQDVCSDGSGMIYTCGSTYSTDGDFAEVDDKCNGSVSVAYIHEYSYTTAAE